MTSALCLALLAFVAAAPIACPGRAAAEDLPAFGDGIARVSLVDGWRTPDGRVIAAIAVSLAPGWHTYWRNPGGIGIPPEFDWSGSGNLSAVEVQWPRPRLFESGDDWSLGYDGTVLLPISVSPRDPARPVSLALDVSMGVCSQVCVPEQISVSARFDPEPGAGDPAAIRAALADRPLTAREAGVSSVSCVLDAGPKGLEMTAAVTFAGPADPGQAVIESSEPGLWIGAPETTVSGGVLTARAPVEAKSPAVDRSRLRLTLVGADQAVEIDGCGPGLETAAQR